MLNIDEKCSIFIVDDERVILRSMADTLTKEGFEVSTTTTGEKAIKIFKKNSFDVVLTDLSLPKMNGIEVLEKVKSIEPETSVIVLTGYGALSSAIEALRLGADDYMLKPCEMDELIMRINNCIKKRKDARELRKYKEIIATTPDMVTMIGPAHKHLIANQSYVSSIGATPKELTKTRVEEVFGEDFYNEKMAKSFEEAFAGRSSQHQNFWSTANQAANFLHFSYSPFRAEDGEVTAVILNIRDLTEYKKMSKELEEVAKRLRLALDVSSDGVWDRNLLTGEVYYGEYWARLVGYTTEELSEKRIGFWELIHPEDKKRVQNLIDDHFEGKTERYVAEFRLRKKNGDWQWILARGKVVERAPDDGKALRFVGTHTDINAQKEAEFKLLQNNEELEKIVQQRTEQLAQKSDDLEQYNAALTVLLKKREQDKSNLEERMVSNIKVLILPYIEKLKKANLREEHTASLNIVEGNIQRVLSPFLHRLSVQHLNFTPTEIQVANLIKDGLSSKEIANQMNLSPETINNHRKNIRKKAGISNKKANLRTILTSFDNS